MYSILKGNLDSLTNKNSSLAIDIILKNFLNLGIYAVCYANVNKVNGDIVSEKVKATKEGVESGILASSIENFFFGNINKISEEDKAKKCFEKKSTLKELKQGTPYTYTYIPVKTNEVFAYFIFISKETLSVDVVDNVEKILIEYSELIYNVDRGRKDQKNDNKNLFFKKYYDFFSVFIDHISKAKTEKEFFNIVADKITSDLGFDIAFKFEFQLKTIFPSLFYCNNEKYASKGTICKEEYITNPCNMDSRASVIVNVIKCHQIMIIEDVRAMRDMTMPRNDKRMLEILGDCKTIVHIPLYSEERDVGVLTLILYNDNVKVDGDLRNLLDVYSRIISSFLIKSQKYDNLQSRNIELENEVAEYKKELQRVKDNNSRDGVINANIGGEKFLAQVSHELRTPTHGIIGLTDTLLEREGDDDKEKHLKMIKKSGLALLRLVNDILDSAKINSGEMTLISDRFSWYDDVLTNVRTDLESLMKEKAGKVNVFFRTDIGNNEYCIGDSLRIKQIFTNLMSNAIKFTDNGEVTLDIQYNKNEHVFDCCIRDTGKGMTEDQIRDVFGDFKQIKGEKSGTGLGLGISRQLIKLMNGEISVKSTPGEGSAFSFTLEMEICRTNDQRAKALIGKKAFLIDSRIDRAKIIQEFLHSQGADIGISLMYDSFEEKILLPENKNIIIDLSMIHGFDEWNKWLSSKLIDKEFREKVILFGTNSDFSKIISGEKIRKLHKPLILKEMIDVINGDNNTSLKLVEKNNEGVNNVQNVSNVESMESNENTGMMEMISNRVVDENTFNVLVVDDNPINQVIASEAVRLAGFNCFFANNGKEAIEHVNKNTVDLILMDMEMPIMGGVEATERILDSNRHMSIFMISANSDEVSVKKAMNSGVKKCIEKPFNVDELANQLKGHFMVA